MKPVDFSMAIIWFKKKKLKQRQPFYNIFKEKKTFQNQSIKKRRQDDTTETSQISAKEVCEIFVVNVKQFFDYKNHLNAFHLFVSIYFFTYENNFSSDYFNKTGEEYPFLDVWTRLLLSFFEHPC